MHHHNFSLYGRQTECHSLSRTSLSKPGGWIRVTFICLMAFGPGSGSFSAHAASRRLPGPLTSINNIPISPCTRQNSQDLIEGLSRARNLNFSSHAHPLCQNLEKNLRLSNSKMRDAVHEMHQLHEDIYSYGSNIRGYMQGVFNGTLLRRQFINQDEEAGKITKTEAHWRRQKLDDYYERAVKRVDQEQSVLAQILTEGPNLDIKKITGYVSEDNQKQLRSIARAQKANTYARSQQSLQNFFKNFGAGLKFGCFKEAPQAEVRKTLLSAASMLDLIDLQDKLSITLPSEKPFKHRMPRFQGPGDHSYTQLVSSLFDFDISSVQSPSSDNQDLINAIECSIKKVAKECQWPEDIQTTTCINCTQPAPALASESQQVQNLKEALSPQAKACKSKERFFNRLLAQSQKIKTQQAPNNPSSPSLPQTNTSGAGQ